MKHNSDLLKYLECNYREGENHYPIVKHIIENYPEAAIFKYNKNLEMNSFDYVQINFNLDDTNPQKYFFNIPCDEVPIFNDLISVNNIDKEIILALVSHYLMLGIDDSEVKAINWNDFAPKLEYNDFVFIFNSCKNINDKTYICSKIKYSNISFFGKLWLLCSFKYLTEILSLMFMLLFFIIKVMFIRSQIIKKIVNKVLGVN